MWCGVRSCNESLHVHLMLHSSKISFRYVAQGGFPADTISLYYGYSYGYTTSHPYTYGVLGTLLALECTQCVGPGTALFISRLRLR